MYLPFQVHVLSVFVSLGNLASKSDWSFYRKAIFAQSSRIIRSLNIFIREQFGFQKKPVEMTRLFLFVIFANSLLVIGIPIKQAQFPSDSEESEGNFQPINFDFEQTNVDLKPNSQFPIDATKLPCANNTIRFCEKVGQNIYPAQHIRDVLKKTADMYAEYFNKVETRINFPEPINLCDTYRREIYPQVAMNVNADWRFVVNQPEYPQVIRVELCQKRSSQCNFGDSFPPGYVSSCSQKFTKIPLLSLDDVGAISTYEYEFPSHCQCDLHRVKPTIKQKELTMRGHSFLGDYYSNGPTVQTSGDKNKGIKDNEQQARQVDG